MHQINVRDADKTLRKNIPFLRVPALGEMVKQGATWHAVISVWHSQLAGTPAVTIRLGPAVAGLVDFDTED